MNRDGAIFGILLAAALLPVAGARAADTAQQAEQKRQLRQAYLISQTHGLCGDYVSLKQWQGANWPEGGPAVSQFLNEKLLPRFVSDPAALKDKTPDQVELEFQQFCKQAGDRALQVLSSLEPASVAPEGLQASVVAEQKKQLRDTMLAAIFLGQCQAASALYFDAKPESQDKLKRFLEDEIFSKDAKYRHEEIDADKMINGDASAEVDKIQANQKREEQYWRDCDTVEKKFNEIAEQLKEAT